MTWTCTNPKCGLALQPPSQAVCLSCGMQRPNLTPTPGGLRLVAGGKPATPQTPADHMVEILEQTIKDVREGRVSTVIILARNNNDGTVLQRHSLPMDLIFALGLLETGKVIFTHNAAGQLK